MSGTPFHPSERYLRLRIWQGASPDELLAEARDILRLPGFQGETGEARFAAVTKDFRAKRPFKVLSSKQKPRKKDKNAPPPWMETPLDRDLNPDEYQERYKLDYYGSHPTGTTWMRDALRLWMYPPAREYLALALVSGDSRGAIAEKLKARVKRVTRRPLEAQHVVVFEEMFWNFKGLSRMDLLSELPRYTLTGKEPVAAILGCELAEFAHFGAPLSVDAATMYRVAAGVGYAQIARMRTTMDFDGRSFTAAFTVMRDALERLMELEGEQDFMSNEEKDAIQVREESDFASYDEVMANAELANEARIIEDSWARNIIDTGTRDILSGRNRKSERMGGNLREELILLIRAQEAEAEEAEAEERRAPGERAMSYDEIARAASEGGLLEDIDEDGDWKDDDLLKTVRS